MTEKVKRKMQLKHLRRKAEVTRFAHSKEMQRARKIRLLSQVTIAILSLLMAGLAFVARNDDFPEWGYWLMFGIAIIPPFILFVHNLGIIFGWSSREEQHGVAVYRWGAWIRKCNVAEDRNEILPDSNARADASEIKNAYSECMEKTPLISTSKFLDYKREFKKYKQTSKEIDEEFCREKNSETVE